jgi:hypothetical protein
LTAENEKNLIAISPDSTSGPTPQHPAMMKPGTSVGVDGITTVSINAAVAPAVMASPPAPMEVKKGRFYYY